MKRTTMLVFGLPVHPTREPERRRSRLATACFRVSLRISPGRKRSVCAPNRAVGIASAGGAIAVGAFLLILSLSVAAQISEIPIRTVVNSSGPEKRGSLGSTDSERKLDAALRACVSKPGRGPDMVLIAGGSFEQGSDKSSEGDERPGHTVTVEKPFSLSRCEVTVAEFRLFVNDSKWNGSPRSPNWHQMCQNGISILKDK